jgi:hypothetical protein
MADAPTTLQLQVLQRQYFQLVEPHQLRWPVDAVLKQSDVQAWIYHEMFDMEKIKSPPPDRYQLRVLKILVAKLERVMEDPEEDVCHPSPLWSQNAIDSYRPSPMAKMSPSCLSHHVQR